VPPKDVIFSLDIHPTGPPQDVTLQWGDANLILSRAVETFDIRQLRKALEDIRDDAHADRVVIVREPMRLELLKILDAIEADGRLSPALAELRDAAGSPILGG
jgi:hypothetical protein